MPTDRGGGNSTYQSLQLVDGVDACHRLQEARAVARAYLKVSYAHPTQPNTECIPSSRFCCAGHVVTPAIGSLEADEGLGLGSAVDEDALCSFNITLSIALHKPVIYVWVSDAVKKLSTIREDLPAGCCQASATFPRPRLRAGR